MDNRSVTSTEGENDLADVSDEFEEPGVEPVAAAVLPQFFELFRPVLEVLSDGVDWNVPEAAGAVGDLVHLDQDARRLTHSSGRLVFENRIRWALTNLLKAELVELVGPSTVRITNDGRAVLEAEESINRDFLVRNRPSYAAWQVDMGIKEPKSAVDSEAGRTAWMVRAGRGGVYAPLFIKRSAAIVGWGETGDVGGLPREMIADRVNQAFHGEGARQRGQATNTLFHLVQSMREGDLLVTPEPVSRTVLLGWVSGPYWYLPDPIAPNYSHARGVLWFARVSREELSYGARNSLGTMLTFSQPGHQGELLKLAEAHAGDQPPEPLDQNRRAPSAPEPVWQPVAIPPTASVPPRGALGDFQTFPRQLMHMIEQLNTGELALPDFQRSFVWAPDATRELIVSIVRSFPAGNLLLLQGGSARFKARTAEAAPASNLQPSHLILDGQQRLTSLYQALFGVGQSRFFFDVGALISGAEPDDGVRVLPAERAEALSTVEAQASTLMMPLSEVRNGGSIRWVDRIVRARSDEDSDRVRSLLYDVQQAFVEPLVRYAFPVTVLPESTGLEAVCTIFETLNRTGKPLTPFELISARSFAGGLSLYDYWAKAQTEHPILDDFGIEPYYLLQVIALRLGPTCKRSIVLRLSADAIEREWQPAVNDLAAALSLLRAECGVLVGKWLPYRPMLIPLAVAWREVVNATGPEQGAMRAKLIRWFWCACFTGEYESSSATFAERDSPILRAWLAGGEAPPVVRDFGWDPERWRAISVRQQGLYRATIALTLSQAPRDFHTAAPLTAELIEAERIDDHHVFPRAFLRELGRPTELDSVLNHVLIDRDTNVRIGKNPPSKYLAEIRRALGTSIGTVLTSHSLPAGTDSPLMKDDFESFVTWRLEHLEELLAEKTGRRGTPDLEVAPYLRSLDARIEQVELALRQ